MVAVAQTSAGQSVSCAYQTQCSCAHGNIMTAAIVWYCVIFVDSLCVESILHHQDTEMLSAVGTTAC